MQQLVVRSRFGSMLFSSHFWDLNNSLLSLKIMLRRNYVSPSHGSILTNLRCNRLAQLGPVRNPSTLIQHYTNIQFPRKATWPADTT